MYSKKVKIQDPVSLSASAETSALLCDVLGARLAQSRQIPR